MSDASHRREGSGVIARARLDIARGGVSRRSWLRLRRRTVPDGRVQAPPESPRRARRRHVLSLAFSILGDALSGARGPLGGKKHIAFP